MKKTLAFLVLLVLISFGFGFTNANRNRSAAKNSQSTYDERTYDVSKLIGIKVNNEQGENLGKIKSLLADSHGRIAFAIISYGGVGGLGETMVAVPFGALSYNSPARLYVLDMSKEQLASAPKYKGESDLANPKFADEVYNFFGQHPYWSEGRNGNAYRERNGNDYRQSETQ